MVGLIINITSRYATPVPTPTAEDRVQGVVSKVFQPNQSVLAQPAITNENCALIPSSLKDFALAIFNPSHSPATNASPAPPLPSLQSTAESGSLNKESSMTWADRVKSGKDLILRPSPPSLDVDVRSKALQIVVPAQKKAEAIRTSLRHKLSNSISEVFPTEALVAVINRDLQEIMDALDELARAIDHTVELIKERSKDTAHVLRELLQARHERAQERARKLKDLGERVASRAGALMKTRACVAREKARVLKVATSDIWVAHRRRMATRMATRKGLRHSARRRARSLLFKV